MRPRQRMRMTGANAPWQLSCASSGKQAKRFRDINDCDSPPFSRRMRRFRAVVRCLAAPTREAFSVPRDHARDVTQEGFLQLVRQQCAGKQLEWLL